MASQESGLTPSYAMAPPDPDIAPSGRADAGMAVAPIASRRAIGYPPEVVFIRRHVHHVHHHAAFGPAGLHV